MLFSEALLAPFMRFVLKMLFTLAWTESPKANTAISPRRSLLRKNRVLLYAIRTDICIYIYLMYIVRCICIYIDDGYLGQT